MSKPSPGPKGSADSRLRSPALHSETCHPSTPIGPASSSLRPGRRAPLPPGLPRLDWPRRQRPPDPPASLPCPPSWSGPGVRSARCTAAAAIASGATRSPTSWWPTRASRGGTACCASRATDGSWRTWAVPTGRSSGCSGSSGSRSPPTAWCGWATPMTGRSCAACPRPPPRRGWPIRSYPWPSRPARPSRPACPSRPARPSRPAGPSRPAAPCRAAPARAVPRDPDPAGAAAPARRTPVARRPPPRATRRCRRRRPPRSAAQRRPPSDLAHAAAGQGPAHRPHPRQ
jgi:hypothetical protein